MLSQIRPRSYSTAVGHFTANFDGRVCKVSAPQTQLELVVEVAEPTLRVAFANSSQENLEAPAVRVALEHLLAHCPRAQQIRWGDSQVLSRMDFYQGRAPWCQLPESPIPEEFPKRRPKIAGTHYQRYVAEIGKTLSLRTIDIERDLELFHEWHNQPRVYDLWELNKPIEELKGYLEKAWQDPHTISMILELDHEPVGYFEIYWAKEDRIAPYYDNEAYDRGFHFLIGDSKFLGRENTDAALRSVMHFIFADDSRTQRIVAEPRADNKRVLKYVQITPGWRFIKEFDFPHKRAALLMAHRRDFFKEGTL